MYRVKYGAVIGYKKPTACIFIQGTYRKASFPTNHSAVFAPYEKSGDPSQLYSIHNYMIYF